VFFVLGLIGTMPILGLSLVVVLAVVRLLPKPLRAAVRGAGASATVPLRVRGLRAATRARPATRYSSITVRARPE
jgi:hypothetical protein